MSNRKRHARNIRHGIIIVVGLVAAVAAFMAYDQYRGRADWVTVRFSSAGTSSQPFELKVADTHAERQTGLMYKKPGDLAPDQGMLFVSPDERMQAFWMRNTYIPLDMIFLDRQRKVVTVLRDVPVLNDERRPSSAPSMYVIELLAGTAAKAGVEVGAVAEFSRQVSAK